MRKFFNEYFHASQNEKRGFLVLIILIFLGIIFPGIYTKYRKPRVVDYSEFEQQINQFLEASSQKPEEVEDAKLVLFVFDPNTLPRKGFKQLGLSDRLVNTIVKYRKAGGKFYKAEDLLKVYGFNDEDFNRLKSFVKIEKSEKYKVTETKSNYQALSNPTKTFTKSKAKKVIVDLNKSDSMELILVSGIGPVFAKRIINYRNYLGGYSCITQLKEVYGFTDEMFLSMANSFTIDSSKINTININTSMFKQVNRHPYISYNQTKAIFKYRQLMGEFKYLNDLLKYNLLDTITYQKVKPYLVIDTVSIVLTD